MLSVELWDTLKNVTKVEILRQIQVHDMLSVGLCDTLKNVKKGLVIGKIKGH